MDNNLQLLNNTEYRLKFKTGSGINNALIQPVTTHALSFNGTDQHGIISDLEINGAFTISMWIKLADYQSNVSVYPLFLKDYASRDTTDIFLDLGNGRLRASVYDRTGPWSTQITAQMGEATFVGGQLPNDIWHHIMMTYDGTVNDSSIKTFVNGVESITNVIRDTYNISSFNSVNSPADTDVYIGWGVLNNRRFKGEMDQIAIWNSDQSSNISSIYTGNSPADLTSLSPDHLFELNNNTNNSTGASTLSLYGGGEFKPTLLPTLKDPLLGELLLDKTGDIGGVNLDGETRIDTDYTYNGSGEITGSLWIKTNSSKKFIILTDSQSGGYESRFAFGLNGDGNFYVLLGNSGGQQVVHKTSPSSNPLDDGQWHHLVYRVDSSNEATVWVDGVLNATHQINFAIDNSIHVTSYGSGWPDGTAPVYDTWGFDGQLKGLGVWETALTNQQINTIFMSGMDSSVPYESLSPNVWVGPTGPALYACTDTSGTISKVSANLKKMGDVPMLKANANVFTRTSSVSSSGAGFSYSFWFYDDGTETGSQTIFKNDTTHNSHVVVNHDSSTIQFLKHAHSNNIIINNSSIASAITHGYELTYEKNKLNNFLFTKQGADPYFTKLYLNGELVASSDQNVVYYPGDLFNEINPKMTNGEEMEFSLLLGDVAYWDADISDIFDEVYSPNQGHKGYQGDWRNLSIPPYHYWKLGFPMQDGEIKDIGTDGTNHLTSRRPIEETYSAQVYSDNNPTDWLFYPQDGVMHGLSNGQPNPYNPEMFMLVGDTINITRPDSSHPLHIKDSSGNDVAVSNIPYSLNSLSFDGLDDFLDVGNITSINSIANASYSFWYKTSATGKVGLIGGGIGTSAYHWTDGNMYVHSWGDTSASHSITIPTLGNWHHIVCTFESSASKLYVDGSLQSTVDHGNTTASNAGNNFAVGKVSHYNIPDGQKLMDEVAIFTSTLSASDVTAIYNSGVPNDISSLNPTHWWRMGDNNSGSGTTITDQGSGGNDGTLTNGPTFSTNVPSLPAWNGNSYALSLDGSDDFVNLGGSSDFDSVSSFSISAWIKADSFSGYPMILAKTNGTTAKSFQFYIDQVSSKPTLAVNFSGFNSSTDPISTGVWTHVAVTWTSGTGAVAFYINGSANGTATGSTSITTNTDDCCIGAKPSGGGFSNYFDGLIDEVAFFDSALSSSDITSIYNSGVPGDISSLNPVGWWRMGDNDSKSGTTITDQGSGGNDGTLVNGPTFSTDVLVAPFPTDVPGATYTTTFSPTIAGTYQYYCTSHSSMIGNINVLQREGYENIFGIDRSTES